MGSKSSVILALYQEKSLRFSFFIVRNLLLIRCIFQYNNIVLKFLTIKFFNQNHSVYQKKEKIFHRTSVITPKRVTSGGPIPRLSAWAPPLEKNVIVVAI